MHRCPNCNGKIPLKKYFLMNNYKVIQCPHCQAMLQPDRKALSLIGGISGFITALTVGLAFVVFYLLERNYGSEIIIIASVLVIMIYLATVLITRNVVGFKTKYLSHEKD